ncbi:MAG: hypothetical protein HYS12_16010 [Planctomycetes bacterium]|nr:hypothetical protein [Planctomycetota bacterium]
MPSASPLSASLRLPRWSVAWLAVFVIVLACRSAVAAPPKEAASQVLDLSLLVATDYPCTWPAPNWPLYQIKHYRKPGPLGVYNSDILTMDGNTGTQLDFPPHSIALPDSGLPIAGKFGTAFSDKIAAWQPSARPRRRRAVL